MSKLKAEILQALRTAIDALGADRNRLDRLHAQKVINRTLRKLEKEWNE